MSETGPQHTPSQEDYDQAAEINRLDWIKNRDVKKSPEENTEPASEAESNIQPPLEMATPEELVNENTVTDEMINASETNESISHNDTIAKPESEVANTPEISRADQLINSTISRTIEGIRQDEEIQGNESDSNHLDAEILSSMQNLQKDNLKAAVREVAKYRAKTSRLQESIKRIGDKIDNHAFEQFSQNELLVAGTKLKSELENAQGNGLERIKDTSPEAFYYVNGVELSEYHKQMHSGRLVETPYVKSQIKKVSEILNNNGIPLLHGDTGTGKTELAKTVALKTTGKDALLVRGYPEMTRSELTGHHALKSEHITASEVPDKIKETFNEWMLAHPESDQQEKDKAEIQITQKIVSESRATVSEYIMGFVYKAASEGKVVILDEANYIPPGLMANLNQIMNVRPGEEIPVQEDGIEPIKVKEGFGMILTGNLPENDPEKFKRGLAKYQGGRQEFDSALLDRIAPVEHTYLPQPIEGTLQENVAAHNDIDLYRVIIGSLVDKRGNMHLPEGAKKVEEDLWKLAKISKITQLVFSGQLSKDSPHGYQANNSASVNLSLDRAISPRTMEKVLDSWQDDFFYHDLEKHVKDYIIDGNLDLTQKHYLLQLFEAEGFFPEDKWKKDVTSTETGKITKFDLEYIGEANPKPIEFVPSTDIADLLGNAPSREKYPDEIKDEIENNEVNDEHIEAQAELQKVVDELEAKIAEYREDFNIACPVSQN